MKIRRIFSIFAAFAATFAAFGDIYMAGDSTMCNYNPRQYPQQGWGQALAVFMKDPGRLHNRAVGGRSAKSFKKEGRWQKLVDDLKEGDWVIIAFGHNDANKAKADRYSSVPDYKDLMRGFATDVRAKGANAVFATSIPHSAGFEENKGGEGWHVRGGAAGIWPYVQATRELGVELGVPVLDLNKFAVDNLPKLPREEAFRLYMRIAPGEYDNCPGGKSDACHTRDTGAYFYARAAVKAAREQNLGICEYFKPQSEVVFVPIPREGPGKDAKPMKDDYSKEEIAYANEEAAAKEASRGDWQRELMNLRREAERNGMSKDEARKWAAQEFRRRQNSK